MQKEAGYGSADAVFWHRPIHVRDARLPGEGTLKLSPQRRERCRFHAAAHARGRCPDNHQHHYDEQGCRCNVSDGHSIEAHRREGCHALEEGSHLAHFTRQGRNAAVAEEEHHYTEEDTRERKPEDDATRERERSTPQ